MTGPEREPLIARFGTAERGAGGGLLRSSIDAPATADFTLTREQVERSPVDYLAPLDVLIAGEVVFGGSVRRVRPTGQTVAIQARSGIALEEGLMSEMAAHDIPPQDVVYAAAREAGFDDEHLEIHGLKELPVEVFEILVPVESVECERRHRIGDVTLMPANHASEAVADFRGVEHLNEEFATADAAALALVTTAQLYRAEQEALARIDLALASLAVRARYGWSRLPDQRGQSFDRASALALPKRLDVVAVRGLASGRRWLRRPSYSVRRAALDLDGTELSELYAAELAELTDRQALLAAVRAFDSVDPLQRIQALWEAFDAYAEVPPTGEVFSRADRKRILAATARVVTPEQQTRLSELINAMANQPSLKTRVGATLAREGVEFDDHEWDLLWNRERGLRRTRNDSVHGGAAEVPSPETIDYACALLARALLHRLWRRRREGDDRLG